jgi:hypothetical protein
VRILTIRLDAGVAGAGTVQSPRPISGHVVSVRCDGTAFGATADFTITRVSDNGTVLKVTDAVGPWQFQPRETLHTITGGSALSAGSLGVPIDGYLKCVVAQAAASSSAELVVYYLED